MPIDRVSRPILRAVEYRLHIAVTSWQPAYNFNFIALGLRLENRTKRIT